MHLFRNFDFLPWILGAMLTAAILTLFAVVGIFFMRYYTSKQHLKAHHDVAGFVFANIGVLYAVLLGFTVVNVQERFDHTKNMLELEAVTLANLYRDTYVFPAPHKDKIRAAIKAYLKSVLEDEWGANIERKMEGKTELALNQVWVALYDMSALNSMQRLWYQESIRKLNDLMAARLNRLAASKESLGDEMWSFLLAGGLFIVCFICFFSFDNLLMHILMAFVLATSIGCLLYLIYSLDTAFAGAISVSPDPLISVYQMMN